MKSFIAAAIAWSSLCTGLALAGPVDEAKALLEKYIVLGAAFDPAVADLYADDAFILNKRTYPTGQVRELTMPAPQYKALIRQTMPLAKERGDTSTYSEIMMFEDPPGVRLKASRYSVLKKYTSPVYMFVAPDASGRWLIREELSESRP